MYEYFTRIETLLNYYPEDERRIYRLIDLSELCKEITRDEIESEVCLLGRESVIRLKRFREALVRRKERWVLKREAILSSLPGRCDYPLPKKCPGQRIQRNYRDYWGAIVSYYHFLKENLDKPGAIVECWDPFKQEMAETDDIEGLIALYERYFSKNGMNPEDCYTTTTLYTYREDASEMLAVFFETVETIDNAIKKYLGENHSQDTPLFTVAIYQIAQIVNKAGIFEEQLTPDDLLQVLNVNPRYSGIKFAKNKKTYVMSFIYLLANYYKDFGKQNPELWAQQIVPFLGIEYNNYNRHKNLKDKSAATQYKDFMIQLEECLDRYNLLWEYGYDNRSLDEFMKRFIRKK